VPPEIEQAHALTRFAAEARYLGDIEPIIPEDVALAIEIAEGVVEWAQSRYAKSREPAERALRSPVWS
jgi:hypothetical protein